MVVKDVLSVPASPAPIDRLFSIARKVFSQERCRLNERRSKLLMFFHCNSQLNADNKLNYCIIIIELITMHDCMLIAVIDNRKVTKYHTNYHSCSTYTVFMKLGTYEKYNCTLLSTFGFQLEYLYLYLKNSQVLVLYLSTLDTLNNHKNQSYILGYITTIVMTMIMHIGSYSNIFNSQLVSMSICTQY